MKKLKFQNVLQYVAIPRIRIKDVSSNSTLAAASEGRRESRQKRSMGSKDEFDGTGRRDLQMVFDKLHDKKGVTTILKVVVDDLGPSPHTDEAIESSLKHRGVETWDWRRVDLCSEVIYNAAPTVREVHLYWSGNNAVLRSWCDEGGLKMLQDLTAVDVHVQPVSTAGFMNIHLDNRLVCADMGVGRIRIHSSDGEIPGVFYESDEESLPQRQSNHPWS